MYAVRIPCNSEERGTTWERAGLVDPAATAPTQPHDVYWRMCEAVLPDGQTQGLIEYRWDLNNRRYIFRLYVGMPYTPEPGTKLYRLESHGDAFSPLL